MLRGVLAVSLMVASSAVASAGVYVGAGIGTSADMSATENGQNVKIEGNGRSGRLILGYRFGRLSLEGTASRFGALNGDHAVPYDATQATASLKLSFPLGNNFEAFGRAGYERSWLTTSAMGQPGASGDGYVLGLGFEYRLNAIIAGASLFVDYEHQSLTYTSDAMSSDKADVTTGLFTAGVTVSL